MAADTRTPGARASATGGLGRDPIEQIEPHDILTRSDLQASAAVAVIRGRDRPRRVILNGRKLWALRQLLAAGAKGVTPLHNPAPRWSDYVRKLRLAGLEIETIREPHGGPYAGHHGRYILNSKVELEPLAELEAES